MAKPSFLTIAEIAAPIPGRLAICPLPGKDGDLERDLAAIRLWKADLVVSLAETDEMARAGAATLPRRIGDMGIAHHHFPIRDFDVPSLDDAGWPPLSKILHEALAAGRSVLFHCMGGKGRSGMIAMRLMIEAGVDPEAALTAIRAARPGAVETAAQEVWAVEGPRPARAVATLKTSSRP